MNVKNTQWVRLMQGAVVAVIGGLCVVAQQSDVGGASAGTASAKFSRGNWPSGGMRPQMLALQLKGRTDSGQIDTIIRNAVRQNIRVAASAEEMETMMGHLVAAVAVVMDYSDDPDFVAAAMSALVDASQEAGEAAANLQDVAEDSDDYADRVGRIYGVVAAVFSTLGGDDLHFASEFVERIPEAGIAPAAVAVTDPESYVGTAQRAALVETLRDVERVVRPLDIGILDKFNPEQPITSTTTTTTTTRPNLSNLLDSGVPGPPGWPPPTRPSPTPTERGL